MKQNKKNRLTAASWPVPIKLTLNVNSVTRLYSVSLPANIVYAIFYKTSMDFSSFFYIGMLLLKKMWYNSSREEERRNLYESLCPYE